MTNPVRTELEAIASEQAAEELRTRPSNALRAALRDIRDNPDGARVKAAAALTAEVRADLAADIERAKWSSIKADLRADVESYGADTMRDLLECVIEEMEYENADRDKWPVGSRQNPWNRVR